MYPAMKKMQAIIERFDDVYTKMKSDARVIDFNDMEKFAYRILQDDAVSVASRVRPSVPLSPSLIICTSTGTTELSSLLP